MSMPIFGREETEYQSKVVCVVWYGQNLRDGALVSHRHLENGWPQRWRKSPIHWKDPRDPWGDTHPRQKSAIASIYNHRALGEIQRATSLFKVERSGLHLIQIIQAWESDPSWVVWEFWSKFGWSTTALFIARWRREDGTRSLLPRNTEKIPSHSRVSIHQEDWVFHIWSIERFQESSFLGGLEFRQSSSVHLQFWRANSWYGDPCRIWNAENGRTKASHKDWSPWAICPLVGQPIRPKQGHRWRAV